MRGRTEILQFPDETRAWTWLEIAGESRKGRDVSDCEVRRCWRLCEWCQKRE